MCPKRLFNFIHRADLNRPIDMTTTRSCSWCEITIADVSTKNVPDPDNQVDNFFCTEKCFESSRRASFKRTKMCDWCDKMSPHENGVKSGSEYSSTSRASLKSDSVEVTDTSTLTTTDHLQFCNDLCLNNYKKTYFVKETAEILQVKKEKTSFQGDTTKELKASVILEQSSSPGFNKNSVTSNRLTKQYHKSPKIIRSISTSKNQKSSRRISSDTPSLIQKMNNLGHLGVNTIFNPFNQYPELGNSRPNSSIPNLNMPIPPATDNINIPPPNTIYIPVPIPIPIPIYKNAPEILEILHQYGYKQSKSNESCKPKFSSIFTPKCAKATMPKLIEPQTEALDLSRSFGSQQEQHPSTISMSIASSFPIASIMQLNDPYLKRRNRILDAPPSSVSGSCNPHITAVKNFNLNYTELLSSTQWKTGKHSKRKFERNGLLPKSHRAQSPKHIVKTAKSLLRRYPLISLRRTIKSAPSSVPESSSQLKDIAD